MTKRLRVIRYHIQVEAVADDGENLEPVEMRPVVVPANGLAMFLAGLPDQLAALEAEMNAPAIDEQPTP